MYTKEIDNKVRKSMSNSVSYDMSELISSSWELTKKTLGVYIGVIIVTTIFVVILSAILAFAFLGFNSAGFIGTSILSYAMSVVFAPLGVGFIILAYNEDKLKNGQFSDVFNGYQHFQQIAIAALIISTPSVLLSFVSTSIVIPLLISILFSFTYELIAIKKYHFTIALESSVKLVANNLILLVLSVLIIAVVNVFGAICLGVGLLVSIPFSICFGYKIFDLLCLESNEDELDLEDNLIEDF